MNFFLFKIEKESLKERGKRRQEYNFMKKRGSKEDKSAVQFLHKDRKLIFPAQ